MGNTILKLDLDMDQKTFKEFEHGFYHTREKLLQMLGYKITDWSMQNSSKYIHLKITLNKKIGNQTRINYLQFICGDSAMRVMLNQKRIDAGIKNWNKLFVKKESI